MNVIVMFPAERHDVTIRTNDVVFTTMRSVLHVMGVTCTEETTRKFTPSNLFYIFSKVRFGTVKLTPEWFFSS